MMAEQAACLGRLLYRGTPALRGRQTANKLQQPHASCHDPDTQATDWLHGVDAALSEKTLCEREMHLRP